MAIGSGKFKGIGNRDSLYEIGHRIGRLGSEGHLPSDLEQLAHIGYEALALRGGVHPKAYPSIEQGIVDGYTGQNE